MSEMPRIERFHAQDGVQPNDLWLGGVANDEPVQEIDGLRHGQWFRPGIGETVSSADCRQVALLSVLSPRRPRRP
ncbi:hypothetical protein GCM10023160_33470 [Brachybacterium paraconglomeratum]